MSTEQIQRAAAQRPYLLAVGLWLPVMIAGWAVLVPTWLSRGTLGWIMAYGLTLTAVVVATLRSGRATRSIAHVLYETEQSADTRQRA